MMPISAPALRVGVGAEVCPEQRLRAKRVDETTNARDRGVAVATAGERVVGSA